MATMNKTDKWELAVELLNENKVSEDVIEALKELFAPKKGGAHVDIEEVVTRDADGEIVEMICSLSGVSLPATADYFYEDKKGTGVGETGLKRLSIQGEKARKEHAKQIKASKDAIKEDLYAGNIDVATAKDMEANLADVDYSSVGLLDVEDENEAA